MLYVKELLSSPIVGSEGRSGFLNDILIDARTWAVRWLVVETGPWLFGREVLMSPAAVMLHDQEARRILVNLSRDDLTKLPSACTDLPIQSRDELDDIYSVRGYDFGSYSSGRLSAYLNSQHCPARYETAHHRSYDPYLHSAQQMFGFEVSDLSGKRQLLCDLVVEPDSWLLEGLRLKGRRWWHGGERFVKTSEIGRIDWMNAMIALRGEAPSRLDPVLVELAAFRTPATAVPA